VPGVRGTGCPAVARRYMGVMEQGIAWYEVHGVLPGAAADKIKREYDAKAALLRPDMSAGGPIERAQGGHAGAGHAGGGVASARRYVDTDLQVAGAGLDLLRA
jgi:hypothetical protein